MSGKVFLDHAAATPPDPAVLEAMRPFLADQWANPSSLYLRGEQARQALEVARAEVADILGARPAEIIFTSGGTEGANAALFGVLRAHRGSAWVTDAIEHDAVLACLPRLAAEGHPAAVVRVAPSGIVSPDDLLKAVGEETVLVCLMLANNEVGTIQPLSEVAASIAEIRNARTGRGNTRPLYLYTDATQAANYLSLGVEKLGVDLLSLSGSKIYGPRGTGILYARSGVELEPLLYGGGQERGRRSGTENVAGAVGFARALRLAQQLRREESRRVGRLRDEAWRTIQTQIPDARLNGDLRHRLPGNLNLTLPGVDGETLIAYLDAAGIEASTGSACASRDEDPSHVLLALGLSKEEARCSLRLTFGRLSDESSLERLSDEMPRIVRRVRALSSQNQAG